jgi:phage/conjugal plasmid C-4 type zinc finger TraR family protein
MSTLHEMAAAYEAIREPDQLDQAAAIDELARKHGVSAIRARLMGDGADDCEECGEPIPVARRRAAPWATLCVECQSLNERRAQ